jgi:hypothetical protein
MKVHTGSFLLLVGESPGTDGINNPKNNHIDKYTRCAKVTFFSAMVRCAEWLVSRY